MIWQPWKIWYENIRNFQGWWSKHSTGTATAVDLELRCEVVAYLLMSIGGVLLLLLVQLQPALELPEGFVDGQHQPFLQDRKSTRLKLQSLMRISYAVFCLKKKKQITNA